MKQLYMLDTDTSIYTIKNRPISVRKQFVKLEMDQICISVVTYAELIFGTENSSDPKRNRAVLDHFARHLTVHDWDTTAAEHYGSVRHKLEREGTPIGSMDMMIAAHALSIGAVLVTNNEKHFRRVGGLKLTNWVKTP